MTEANIRPGQLWLWNGKDECHYDVQLYVVIDVIDISDVNVPNVCIMNADGVIRHTATREITRLDLLVEDVS